MPEPVRPVDDPAAPDVGSTRGPRALAAAGLVAAGGAVGTAARAVLDHAIPRAGGIPLGILVINLAGAFLLAMLLTVLARTGPDTGRRQTVRLFCGTGLLGGFTTYSALAADTASLFDSGAPLLGLGYALVTVLGGALLSGLGILIGGLVPRPGRREVTG